MPQQQTLSYNRALTITKSDTVNIDGSTSSATGLYGTTTNTKPLPCEAIWVGGAGVVVVVGEDGTTTQYTCIAGELLPVKAIRVNSGSTTASSMLALYTV